ncbi:MAG: hypothetical protein U9N39_05200 [Campylobacterota bacterium]|nr:hypothetical protein [Campylobacterota bacterium]
MINFKVNENIESESEVEEAYDYMNEEPFEEEQYEYEEDEIDYCD